MVADIKMVHVVSAQDHTYKPTNIKAAEQEKRAKCKMYVTAGLGFTPAAVNTFCQLGPDLLRIDWKCAAKAAQRDLPNIAMASLQDSDQDEETAAFKARGGTHYHEFRQWLLEVVYEGVAERLYGVSRALRSSRDYQKWMDYSRPAWTPIFNDPPPYLSDLQVVSQGSSQGESAPAQGEFQGSSQGESAPAQGESQGGLAPSQGQDPALPVVDAAAAFFGSLDVLRD